MLNEKKILESVPLTRSGSKVNVIYFEEKPILHPCLMESHSIVVCIILLTNQPNEKEKCKSAVNEKCLLFVFDIWLKTSSDQKGSWFSVVSVLKDECIYCSYSVSLSLLYYKTHTRRSDDNTSWMTVYELRQLFFFFILLQKRYQNKRHSMLPCGSSLLK